MSAGKNNVVELPQTIKLLKSLIASRDGNHASIDTAIPPSAVIRPTPPSAATPPTTQSLHNIVHSHSEAKFMHVRRGAKPARQVMHSTMCSNRYKILEEEDEPSNSFFTGDSVINQQLTVLGTRERTKTIDLSTKSRC